MQGAICPPLMPLAMLHAPLYFLLWAGQHSVHAADVDDTAQRGKYADGMKNIRRWDFFQSTNFFSDDNSWFRNA